MYNNNFTAITDINHYLFTKCQNAHAHSNKITSFHQEVLARKENSVQSILSQGH